MSFEWQKVGRFYHEMAWENGASWFTGWCWRVGSVASNGKRLEFNRFTRETRVR